MHSRLTQSIGIHVKEIIFVVGKPEAEASIIPEFLIEHLSFLCSVLVRAFLRKTIQEATEISLAVTEELGVEGLSLVLFLSGETPLPHWNSEIWRTLKDLEFASHRAPGLCDLNA